MQQEHIVTSDHRLAYEFVIRGFAVQAPEVAQRAARTADIDLTAPDERTRKNLKIIGQAAGATWVVALTVNDVSEARSGSFLSGGGRRAKAKVEIRVWDVAADTYITNKFYEDTKSTKRMFGVGAIGTTGLFRQAIDTTVQRSVQDLLVPYPIIKHLREQFDETDVVQGESASGLASGGVQSGVPVLAAATPITVVLQSMLRSDVARDGDPVTFHVKDNVYSTDSSHTLFIAKDAVAMGRVIVAKERGYAGKAGTLQFTCDYATAINGKRVYLRSDKLRQVGRSNETGSVALAVLTGESGLLLNGRDAKFDAGTPFTLFVDQDAALPPAPSPVAAPLASPSPAAPMPQTLFTMADGSQVVGRLVSFDGTNYQVATTTGNVSLAAGTVRSMNVLTPSPVTASPTPLMAPAPAPPVPAVALPSPPPAPVTAPPVPTLPAAPVPAAPALPIAAPKPVAPATPKPVAPPATKPAPRLPVISSFPQRVRVEMTNGNSYFGSVTAFDGDMYFLTIPGGNLNVKGSDIKTLEILSASGS